MTGKPTNLSEFQTAAPSPLTQEELEICSQTARHLPARRDADFIFQIVPYTGLWPTEFVHLKESWIVWPDDAHGFNIPVIEIPERDTCAYARYDKTPPTMVKKDGPCLDCRRHGDTDDWTGTHPPNPRQIPVHAPVAQKALRRFFKTYRYDVNPWGPDQRKEVIRRINETASLSRKVTHADLTHTFIHICAEVQEMSRDEILTVGPISNPGGPVKRILANTSTEYNQQFEPADYLRWIAMAEPVTCKELAEVSGKSYNVARRAINNLVGEGLVAEIGKRDRSYGTDVAEYSLTEDADSAIGIPCTHTDCTEIFGTFRGRAKHESIVHGDESLPGNSG